MAYKKLKMHNCCKKISSGDYLPTYHSCPNLARFRRKGKWYCGTHDPERIAAVNAKKRRKFDEKCEQRHEYLERKQALSVLGEGIPTKDLEKYKLVLKESGP